MFDQLSDIVAQASTWAYIVLALVAMLDAMLPIVPSETAVITAGVLASTGDLLLPLVIGCAATGAFLGDNAVYPLGHRSETAPGDASWPAHAAPPGVGHRSCPRSRSGADAPAG